MESLWLAKFPRSCRYGAVLPKAWSNSALDPETVDIHSLNPARRRRIEPKRDAYATGTPDSLFLFPYGLGKSSYLDLYIRVVLGLVSTWISRCESVKRSYNLCYNYKSFPHGFSRSHSCVPLNSFISCISETFC
jgi:hypothetical protein